MLNSWGEEVALKVSVAVQRGDEVNTPGVSYTLRVTLCCCASRKSTRATCVSMPVTLDVKAWNGAAPEGAATIETKLPEEASAYKWD